MSEAELSGNVARFHDRWRGLLETLERRSSSYSAPKCHQGKSIQLSLGNDNQNDKRQSRDFNLDCHWRRPGTSGRASQQDHLHIKMRKRKTGLILTEHVPVALSRNSRDSTCRMGSPGNNSLICACVCSIGSNEL